MGVRIGLEVRNGKILAGALPVFLATTKRGYFRQAFLLKALGHGQVSAQDIAATSDANSNG